VPAFLPYRFWVVCLLLSACAAPRPVPSGAYQRRGKDFVTRLELKAQDSTFTYSYKAYHVSAGCRGTWVYQRDTLYLRCVEEAFPAPISSGYLSNRKLTAVLEPGNRVRLNGTVLKRSQ
jgi:hypothetical protein